MEKSRRNNHNLKGLFNEPIIWKTIMIGIIIVLLMIPISMVQKLINERQSLKVGVVEEVSDKWGGSQIVTGPIIMVPYQGNSLDSNYQVVENKILHILPEQLDIKGEVLNELRKRNNFKVMLYKSKLHLSGQFLQPDWEELQIDTEKIIWNEAWVSVGISDNKGIRSHTEIKLGKKWYALNSGSEAQELLKNGLHSKIKWTSEIEQLPFEMEIDLQGTNYIGFNPVGKETTVNLTSPWPSPSFQGNFLREKLDLSEKGFDVSWKIFDLNRTFPQTWIGEKYSFKNSDFGVTLIESMNEYQLNYRSGKYALFVIALTFLVFFFFEIIGKHHLHPFQYLLIGLAISIFYLLLLSFSEQVGFIKAYLIAASATIGLILIYSKFILDSFKQLGLLGLFLVMIYSFIFVVLQLENLALLIGSIGLFIVLALVMYLSRNVNWYQLKPKEASITKTETIT